MTSPYPVILSIENRCSIVQQQKMAQIFVVSSVQCDDNIWLAILVLNIEASPGQLIGPGPTFSKLLRKILGRFLI